jgi:hypothetical protein
VSIFEQRQDQIFPGSIRRKSNACAAPAIVGTGGKAMAAATNVVVAKPVTLFLPSRRHPGNSHEGMMHVEAILEEVDGR